MGYCILQRQASFTIKAENKLTALKAVKTLVKVGETEGGGASYRNGQERRFFRWLNLHDISAASSLEEMLQWWRWQPRISENNDIVGLSFTGEKAGDDRYLWTALAPFVESGSFIEMQGEDGRMWRWTFDSGQFKEIVAEINWPKG